MIKKIFFITALSLIAFVPASGFLKVLGQKIVDENNQNVLLKGYGLGGWLVPEGYMLHFPGTGSPTSIRQQIISVIGTDGADEFFELYRENYVTEADIALIASWGFNSIRLPFHYEFFSPIDSPGVFIETGFRFVDSTLTWCKRNNLYLILDMHCAPGGQNADNISDSDGTARLWTESANQDRTVAIWRYIAERYSNEEWIIGYDLLNEPVMPSGYSNTNLRSLYIRIRDAIREVDTNHILFIEGSQYATDFTSLTPRFDSNMAYAFHKYWSETTQSTIQSLLNIRTNYLAPLWLGESGENSNPWYYETVTLMNTQNIGWNWWAHKKFETTTSPLSATLPTNIDLLIDYWNGSATQPSASQAKTILMEMAANLALDKCTYRPDVIAALTDDEFGTTVKPYKSHDVPGVISAVDYDIGNQGLAYYDNDYKRVRWDVWQPWNDGGEYRNDGVDIETKSAALNDYDIGWIEDGEWLSYTVNVLYNSNYKIICKVASTNASGRFRLLVDDTDKTGQLSVPNTGSWQTWKEVTTSEIALTKGTHQLKFEFTTGGFNLFQIQINPVSNGVFQEFTDQVFIGKNYPNPFNATTTLPFYISETTRVELTIFDLRGCRIKTLYKSLLNAGHYAIRWDGRDESGRPVASGTYLYHLVTNNKEKTWQVMLLR